MTLAVAVAMCGPQFSGRPAASTQSCALARVPTLAPPRQPDPARTIAPNSPPSEEGVVVPVSVEVETQNPIAAPLVGISTARCPQARFEGAWRTAGGDKGLPDALLRLDGVPLRMRVEYINPFIASLHNTFQTMLNCSTEARRPPRSCATAKPTTASAA